MSLVEISTDVLVLGGGPAAFFAAIKAKEAGAKKVTMVCKAVAGTSGSAAWIMGNIRDYRPEESEELVPILILTCLFLADQDWLEYTIKENYRSVNDLRKWGVKFLKKSGQEIRIGMGTFTGGESNPNVWVDGGALRLLSVLRGQAIRAGVNIIDRVMITDLLTSDGKHPTGTEVAGAVGFNVRSGDFNIFTSKATVLATGGSGIPKRYPADITSDGHAMAIRAGAIMRGMDYITFVRGGTLGNATTGSSHVFSSFGAKLVNTLYPDQKEDQDYSPRQSTRGMKWKFDMKKALEAVRIDKLDSHTAENYTGPCWDWGWQVSFRDCTPENLQMIYKTNPRIMKIFEKLGIEIPEDMVPLVRFPFEGGGGSRNPAGVRINRNHESSLPGLFAAGDVSDKIGYIGAGGMNSAMTGGRIAGTSAAEYAEKRNQPILISYQVEMLKKNAIFPREIKNGISPLDLRIEVVKAVCQAILDKGFIVNEQSLQKAIDALEKLRVGNLPSVMAKDSHQLMKANELRSILDVIPLQLKAAKLRQESRVLVRDDYPYLDNKNWLKFINSRLKEDGEVDFWTEDVPPMKVKPEGM